MSCFAGTALISTSGMFGIEKSPTGLRRPFSALVMWGNWIPGALPQAKITERFQRFGFLVSSVLGRCPRLAMEERLRR